MKKLMSMLIACVAIVGAAMTVAAAPTTARVTSGEIVVATTATNGASEVWVDTGDNTEVKTSAGTVKVGAGIVRSLVFNSPNGAMTNWVIRFYAYDAGVKKSLYTASSTTAAPTTGRVDFDATNLIFTGKIRVEVFQNYAYTNAPTTYRWSAVVQ